jgi:hypothetical protein
MRRFSCGLAVLVAACGGSSSDIFKPHDGGGEDVASSNNPDTGPVMFSDAGPVDSSGADDAPTQEIDYVYAQSPTVLYKVDPVAKTMTTVGNFNGCTSVVDIAVDANSNGYATTFSGVYKLDLTTAVCTLIATGSYPNSLSFVPKGTLDPSVEALVGYNGSTYIRIDTTTGAVTNVGSLTGGYESSGDIVSVANGGTFLTVTGNSCGDCLLQVNPVTGDMIQNYGSVNHAAVYGLAFWAGTAYGFDDAGELFSITWSGSSLVTTNIPTTMGLEFWGAGSTTSAPPKSADGGGLPVN